jgi:hypothetical protein
VSARNDEDVNWRLRVDVAKRNRRLRLGDVAGGNFSGDNSAEKTIRGHISRSVGLSGCRYRSENGSDECEACNARSLEAQRPADKRRRNESGNDHVVPFLGIQTAFWTERNRYRSYKPV